MPGAVSSAAAGPTRRRYGNRSREPRGARTSSVYARDEEGTKTVCLSQRSDRAGSAPSDA